MKRIIILPVVVLILLCSIESSFGQAIPEEAQRYFSRGIAAAEMAHSTVGYEDAIREFEKAKALHDYIKNEYQANCCRVITADWQGEDFKSQARKNHCISITGRVARWVASEFIDDGQIIVKGFQERSSAEGAGFIPALADK